MGGGVEGGNADFSLLFQLIWYHFFGSASFSHFSQPSTSSGTPSPSPVFSLICFCSAFFCCSFLVFFFFCCCCAFKRKRERKSNQIKLNFQHSKTLATNPATPTVRPPHRQGHTFKRMCVCVCVCVLATYLCLSPSLPPAPIHCTYISWMDQWISCCLCPLPAARSPLPLLIERHLMRRVVAALLQQ